MTRQGAREGIGKAMPFIEAWTFAAPRPNGTWEVWCTQHGLVATRITADGAKTAIAEHRHG